MRSRLVLATALSGLCFACSGGEDNPDMGPVDAGPNPVDMGPAPIDMGPGPVDMGPAPDMGPEDMGPEDMGEPVCGEPDNNFVCNPVDGAGCDGDQSCVLQTTGTQSAQCRVLFPDPPLGPPSLLGAECEPQNQNCEAGTVCLSFQGGPGPRCYQVCDTRNDNCGSESVPGSTACARFGGTTLPPRFGTCQTP